MFLSFNICRRWFRLLYSREILPPLHNVLELWDEIFKFDAENLSLVHYIAIAFLFNAKEQSLYSCVRSFISIICSFGSRK